jgi:Kef-type K+ transport system membrane component KefB
VLLPDLLALPDPVLAVSTPSVGAAPNAGAVALLALALAVILVAAKVGGDLAARAGQPAVLGELVAGIILGNLVWLGFAGFEPIKDDAFVRMLAELGVILLLFEVGLQSTVRQMLRVGTSAAVVASLGVAAPMALGWLVGRWLVPQGGSLVHAFLGATLAATSVGITARVLRDLGESRSEEARVILGAAVIDDVLGLVVLAVITAAIAAANAGTEISYVSLGWTLAKALVFLSAAVALGVAISPRLFSLASRLQARGVLLAVGLAFCFFFAWLAHALGLAAIVGAFAAGLILEDTHYRDFLERGEHGLEELVHPISEFLAPVFFVLMGMRTDLSAFARLEILGLGAALTVAAIAGKQVCGLGVFRSRADRLTVGIGMIPRGEVGLIFASVGAALTLNGRRIVEPAVFSAVVVMVVATTLVTPPALAWSFRRKKQG